MAVIRDADAEKKAGLVVALLIGTVVLQAVIKSDPLASATRSKLEAFIVQIDPVAASEASTPRCRLSAGA